MLVTFAVSVALTDPLATRNVAEPKLPVDPAGVTVISPDGLIVAVATVGAELAPIDHAPVAFTAEACAVCDGDELVANVKLAGENTTGPVTLTVTVVVCVPAASVRVVVPPFALAGATVNVEPLICALTMPAGDCDCTVYGPE